MELNGQDDRDGPQDHQSQDQQGKKRGQSQQGGQQGNSADKEPARGPDGNGQNAGGGVAELEIEKLGGIGEGEPGK